MGRRKRNADHDAENGFAEWGGYKNAKVSKLDEQFKQDAEIEKISDIFNGVAIMVNGITKPDSKELKKIMAQHGGIYHMYPLSSTTHIIASNLAVVKIRNLGTKPVVKPAWITESIALGKLIDFRRYLLYTNQSVSQPKLDFPVVEKSMSNSTVLVSTPVASTNTPVVQSSKITESEATSVTPTNASMAQSSKVTKTAADPKFLEEFYNNSRLHLISTLGAEFKQLVCQMRDKHDGIFLGKQKLLAISGKQSTTVLTHKVIMHIDMDCFFVSVGLKNHPELKGKPVAITHARSGRTTTDRSESREVEFALYNERVHEGDGRVDKIDGRSSMSEIASCSYEARKCGVRNGMFMGQAIKLCPDLKTLPYDFEGYKEVSHILYKTIASYTLDIEAVSCDEMYVDCTQILNETGMGVLDWATHIRHEIMSITGCPCSTGFGSNRLQARLATRKAKPAGQYYLEADDVEVYMTDIPLADLPGVGRATLAKLANLGLTTSGDVQIASLKILQKELGMKAGETLMDQAKGVDKKPLNYYHERKSVSAEVNYGIRFKTLEECQNFLQSLSNEVYNRLADTGMRARCLTLKLLVRAENAPVETAKFLGHGVCDSLTKSTTSNMAINDANTIYKEAKAIYDKLNPPFVDLRGMGIQLTKLEKLSNMNTALSRFLKKKDQDDVTPIVKTVKTISTVADVQSKNVVTDVITPGEAKKPASSSIRGRPKRSRGRGRGGKSLDRTAQSSTIKTIFEKKQTPVTPQKQDIDFDVLNQLPEEIRNEIIKEYQLNTPNITEKPKEPVHKSTQCKEIPKENPKNNPSPFSKMSWDEIKPIIKNWVQSEDKPEMCDAQMIAEHFKQLAIDRKIEILMTIFNFLHRIFSTLTCCWHEAYYLIADVTQQGMVARYGKTLAIQRDFGCCHM